MRHPGFGDLAMLEHIISRHILTGRNETSRIKAFISYSHQADSRLAPAIQAALKRFARPWYRIRWVAIFRDETNLGINPHLWSSIEDALERSEYFLLLASPAAARSTWVQKEVAYWLRYKSQDTLLIVLTEGEIKWNNDTGDFDWDGTTALPRTLSQVFPDVPFYADLRLHPGADLSFRNPTFQTEIAKIAAPLHGRKLEELIGEEVRQRRRWNVFLLSIMLVLLTTTSFAVWNAYRAAQQQSIAEQKTREAVTATRQVEQERNVAEQQRQLAERQADIAQANEVKARQQEKLATQNEAKAVHQQQIAEERAQVAQSQRLAAEARTLVNDRLDLALLLSVQSLRTFETFEAKNTLLSTLSQNPYLSAFVWDTTDADAVAFSPDGSLLAVGSCGQFNLFDPFCVEGKITLWDTSSRKMLRSFSGSKIVHVTQMRFTPDGLSLAAADGSGAGMAVWDVMTGEKRWENEGATPIAISPDGATIAYSVHTGSSHSGATNWAVSMRMIANGQTTRNYEDDRKSPVSSIAISPDGRSLAVGRRDGVIKTWSVVKEGPPQGSWGAHQGSVSALAFTEDGHTLISGGADNAVVWWNPETGTEIRKPSVQHQLGIIGLAVASTGQLLTADRSSTVTAWDVKSGGVLRRYAGSMNGVATVSFSPNGSTLAWTGSGKFVAIWDLSARHPLAHSLNHHTDRVSGVAFSPDGSTVASAGWRDGVRLWSRRRDQSEPKTLGQAAYSAAFGADGKTVVVGTGRTVGLWDAASGRSLGDPLTGHRARVVAVAVSPGGIIASGSHDHTVRLWDLARRREVSPPVVIQHESQVIGVTFSFDGKRLASADANGHFRVWDLQRRRLDASPGVRAIVGSVAFSADGKTLAYGTKGHYDKQSAVEFWDLERDIPSREPISIGASVANALAFSRDGTLLAVGSDTLQLWDVTTYRRIGGPLVGHLGPVRSVTFSPDSRSLVSGGEDGAVLLWDTTSDGWARTACRTVGRNFTHEEWRTYLGNQPYQETCAWTHVR